MILKFILILLLINITQQSIQVKSHQTSPPVLDFSNGPIDFQITFTISSDSSLYYFNLDFETPRARGYFLPCGEFIYLEENQYLPGEDIKYIYTCQIHQFLGDGTYIFKEIEFKNSSYESVKYREIKVSGSNSAIPDKPVIKSLQIIDIQNNQIIAPSTFQVQLVCQGITPPYKVSLYINDPFSDNVSEYVQQNDWVKTENQNEYSTIIEQNLLACDYPGQYQLEANVKNIGNEYSSFFEGQIFNVSTPNCQYEQIKYEILDIYPKNKIIQGHGTQSLEIIFKSNEVDKIRIQYKIIDTNAQQIEYLTSKELTIDNSDLSYQENYTKEFYDSNLQIQEKQYQKVWVLKEVCQFQILPEMQRGKYYYSKIDVFKYDTRRRSRYIDYNIFFGVDYPKNPNIELILDVKIFIEDYIWQQAITQDIIDQLGIIEDQNNIKIYLELLNNQDIQNVRVIIGYTNNNTLQYILDHQESLFPKSSRIKNAQIGQQNIENIKFDFSLDNVDNNDPIENNNYILKIQIIILSLILLI